MPISTLCAGYSVLLTGEAPADDKIFVEYNFRRVVVVADAAAVVVVGIR